MVREEVPGEDFDLANALRAGLLAALAISVGLLTAGAVVVHVLFGMPVLRGAVSSLARMSRIPLFRGAVEAAGQLGSLPVMVGIAALVCLLLIRAARSIQPAVFLAVLVGVGQGLQLVVKVIIHRLERGPILQGVTTSFPSSSAVAAVTLYGGIAYLVARRTRSAGVKLLAWSAAASLSLALASGPLLNGVQSEADVVGGVVFGAMWLTLAVAALRIWEGMGKFETLREARNKLAGWVLLWGLIAVSIGIVIHVAVLAFPGIEETAAALRRLEPAFVLVAVALEVVSFAALGQMYRRTVQQLGGEVSYFPALAVSMGGFTVGRVLPGGGATAAVFMARGFASYGIPVATAISAVLIGGMLAMGVLGIIVLVGAISSLFKGQLPAAYMIGIPVILALLAGLGVLIVKVLSSAAVRDRVVRLVDTILRGLHLKVSLESPLKFLEDVAAALPPLRRLASPARWSALNWLTQAAALWVLFLGFGYRINLGVLLIGYGVANLVTALPITPGGLGLVEAGVVATYVAFGVPAGVAVVTVLAYRLVSYWLPVAAGVPGYLRSAGRRVQGSSMRLSEQVET